MNDLTPAQKQLRMNIRNFLLIATPEELQNELAISLQRGDDFRAQCVQELIDENQPKSEQQTRELTKLSFGEYAHAIFKDLRKRHEWVNPFFSASDACDAGGTILTTIYLEYQKNTPVQQVANKLNQQHCD